MIELKAPPSGPKKALPAHNELLGRIIIVVGFVICAVGFAASVHNGVPLGRALVSVLPLVGIFAATGWSYRKMGDGGAVLMFGYLGGSFLLYALFLAWLTGK